MKWQTIFYHTTSPGPGLASPVQPHMAIGHPTKLTCCSSLHFTHHQQKNQQNLQPFVCEGKTLISDVIFFVHRNSDVTNSPCIKPLTHYLHVWARPKRWSPFCAPYEWSLNVMQTSRATIITKKRLQNATNLQRKTNRNQRNKFLVLPFRPPYPVHDWFPYAKLSVESAELRKGCFIKIQPN